jgi:glycosyltransferase involved in cell wall biosynthesis
VSISIIIATYGEETWAQTALTRALPSVEGVDAEVLIGHDPEATIAGVRNEIASHATGKWLCFLDADDELAPGYIEAMTQAMQRKCLLTPRVQQIINRREHPAKYYPEVNLMSGNWLVVGTLIERSLFKKVGGFGDYPHGFKATKLGAEVVRVDDAIYRQHVNPRSKHRMGWRNRRYQVSTHHSVQAELEAWTP